METSQSTRRVHPAEMYTFSFLRTSIAVLLVSTLLVGCAFFERESSTTEPVELEAYEPTTSAEPEAAESEATESAAEPSADDSGAEDSSAEGNTASAASATESSTEASSTEASSAEASSAEESGADETEAEPAAANAESAGSESDTERAAASASPARTLQDRVYNGNVVAQQQVDVVVEASGEVLAVNVEVGDRVQRGDVLLEVDSASLEAQKAQALASLSAAEAQVDLLLMDPDETDLEAARAAVVAASESYQRAQEGPTAEDQTIALSQLRQAEASVRRAQAAYNEVSWSPQIGALPQSEQLQQATLQLEAAQAQYEKTTQPGTADVVAGAYAQLASARAQLQALQNGPDEPQIEAAQAQVRQAEAALYLAQLQLNNAVITAPFAGVISDVNTTVGAMAAPGTPAFTLLSEDVEVVVSVEESLLAQLEVGQPATIRASAYPDQSFDGEVALVAPVVDASTRTVQVTIRPVDENTGLSPGMFATVQFGS